MLAHYSSGSVLPEARYFEVGGNGCLTYNVAIAFCFGIAIVFIIEILVFGCGELRAIAPSDSFSA